MRGAIALSGKLQDAAKIAAPVASHRLSHARDRIIRIILHRTYERLAFEMARLLRLMGLDHNKLFYSFQGLIRD